MNISCRLRLSKFWCIVFITVVMLFVSAVSSGCRPGGQSSRDEALPSLPPEIDAGERKEPQISVYVVEEDAVVTMPIEEYIAGVVAGEMDPSWPLEALAAQAIMPGPHPAKIAENGCSPP